MPIVKKGTKVIAAKTVTQAGGRAGKRPAVPEIGQRYIQFYYSIAVAGSTAGLDIRKFNGSTPIGPVGGPPHFPESILHPISDDLHAQLSFHAPKCWPGLATIHWRRPGSIPRGVRCGMIRVSVH